MKINNNDSDNFWVAYADLMAGLLFVFILIVGAIVIKYVFTQNELSIAKDNMAKQEEIIIKTNNELNKKEKAINAFVSQLNDVKDKNIALGELNEFFNNKLSELRNNITDISATLKNISNENSALSSTISSKDEKILNLQQALAQKTSDYEVLLSDLNRTRISLKNVSDLRTKIISTLQKQLGSNIRLNETSGSITLPTSILFDVNSFQLKDTVKFDLRRILNTYFDILLQNDIRPYIDKITIEGHTDSDGSYLYNLELSQKRAFEVMKFIYSFYKNKDLQKYLLASGRSFSDLVYKNGKEDPESSRRIEIKFSISNKTAINEIENILRYRR